jgi:hypothetical protein
MVQTEHVGLRLGLPKSVTRRSGTMLFEKIIRLAKKDGWKEQLYGIAGISGSIGTNLYKDGKVLSISIVEQGHITYPDEDEIRELFGEK